MFENRMPQLVHEIFLWSIQPKGDSFNRPALWERALIKSEQLIFQETYLKAGNGRSLCFYAIGQIDAYNN